MSARERKQDYAISDKAEHYADLLFMIVQQLDSGTQAYRLADQVETIGKLMR